jgi:hypothetical protein
MNPVEAFFGELDAGLAPPHTERIELRIVGSTALFLQTSYTRGTKDCDAVETYNFDAVVKEALLAVGGTGSSVSQRHGIYLEFVAEGLLFLPEEPRWNPLLTLNTLDLYTLDPTDVVVAKLIRLHGDDLADIEAMVRLGLVHHERVVERFQSAVLHHGTYGRSDLLRPTIKKFHRVERDIFGVEESDIEIPEWMDA